SEAHAEHARENERDHADRDGRLFQIHACLNCSWWVSEADGSGHLKRVPLVRGAIAELFEKLDAKIEPVIWNDQVRHQPERIDGVPLAGLLLGDRRSILRCRLALLVAR